MPQTRISVALDKPIVQGLLNGLMQGSKGRLLKVVLSADDRIYVESKELRIVLAADGATHRVSEIQALNERQVCVITGEMLREMGLDRLAEDAVREIREHYSPYAHNLAENLHAFSRQYGNG